MTLGTVSPLAFPLSVTVTEVEDMTPTLVAVSNQTCRAGQAGNARLLAGGNAPLQYTLTGPSPVTAPTLPAGLTFDPATRRIQGTPEAAAAEATPTLTVMDANPDTAARTFMLEVEENPLPGFSGQELPVRHPLNQEVYSPQRFPAPGVQGGRCRG